MMYTVTRLIQLTYLQPCLKPNITNVLFWHTPMYSAHTSITVPLQKIYHFIWNECLWDWLNPSIFHDQQNTSPVREICVFGEKNKKQFGIITLQQHVHRLTALEKNFIFSNRMAKELYQIRLWRTRYLRVRICMHSPRNIYRPTDPIEKKVYVTEN